MLFIAHIRVALIFVKTPSPMYYVLSASFMPRLIYLAFMHAFMRFTVLYCDRIAPPYPYPFVCNYAYSSLMTLFLLVALDCLKVQELSFSWRYHLAIIISLVSLGPLCLFDEMFDYFFLNIIIRGSCTFFLFILMFFYDMMVWGEFD